MAAIPTTSAFCPSTDEKRWVSQGLNFIRSEVKIDIEITPTIFQVPKALRETKPEAYNPQNLGLGPYHHLRPEFHVTDRHKHAMVKKFLENNSLASCSENVLDKMKNLEPVIRGNYDKYLDLEGATLEYIIAIDSLYLLAFLQYCNEKNSVDTVHETLAKDVLMLENQIPAAALRLMGKEIGLSHKFEGDGELYENFFYEFCSAHSPLQLADLKQHDDRDNDDSKHLLAYMYYLIVNNRAGKDDEKPASKALLSWMMTSENKQKKNSQRREGKDESEEGPVKLVCEIDKELGALPVGGNAMKPVLLATHFVEVLAKSSLARHLSKREKKNVEEIQIPSVSELYKKHKVEFKLIQHGGGIRDIKFHEAEEEGKTSTLYLPKITLEYDSEVVLRNLLAYEAAVSTSESSKLEFTDYVDLMCGIVDTEKDVQILRDQGIIAAEPKNDKIIVEMFNGISRSKVVKSGETSESRKAVEGVNEMVKKWEDKRAWRRARRSCNKIGENSREFLKKNAAAAVKYLTYIFMALLLALQILQAYCEVYGCGKGESAGTTTFATSMSVI